ncbi:DUF898 domain-containing protein [Thalassomonas viridans]|uniref:DUF898 domain-containing protein n=1 Tax=Thalassomonas viridans TaxID=137584 RepID=A0AAE9YZD0_9GAMM|nr:YjgN family protein [Thalassomonas viridans]WDE03367.1 DUF898 domain-containing protein [Thalassomonas viridans]
MENSGNYAGYSLDELVNARANISDDTENAAYLDQLIAEKRAQQAQPKQVTMKFHGKTREYYAIWIVNLLLSIVTLGIYSAWAKVRTQRYFFANTEIDNHRFTYLAEPLQILKGRIIALVVFGGFFLLSTLSPLMAGIFMLFWLAAVPWLVCKSVQFNMRMTGYRNIRFNFHGQYLRALVVFVIYPILSLFTLYLTMPMALKTIDEFLCKNISYGDKRINTNLSYGSYYKAAFGSFIIAVIIFGLGFTIFAPDMSQFADPEQAPGLMFQLGLMAAYLVVFIIAGSFYTKVVRNHMFANSQLEDIANFNSSVGLGSLVALRTTNLLALICTLGLAFPWIKIRNSRYFCQHTQIQVLPGADSVVADQAQGANAIGDEVSEIFDMDIAIT